MKFKVGDKVSKPKGYSFDGIVVAVFENTKGEVRVVAELEGNGMLHIFTEGQLEVRLEKVGNFMISDSEKKARAEAKELAERRIAEVMIDLIEEAKRSKVVDNPIIPASTNCNLEILEKSVSKEIEEEHEVHPLKPLFPRWIPINEFLPEMNNRVLVLEDYYGDKEIRIGLLTSRTTNTGAVVLWENFDPAVSIEGVTHWMPLPETPKVK